jgi:hypothetical protein
MGIEAPVNRRRHLDRSRTADAHCPFQRVEVGRIEHMTIQHRQAVERILIRLGPIDQFIEHIIVDPERQHLPDDSHVVQGSVRNVAVAA